MAARSIGLDARPYLKARTGVERYAENIALGMAASDRGRRLVFFSDAPMSPDLARALPGEVVVVPRNPRLPQNLFDFWLARTLPRHLSANGVEVFYSISTKMPLGSVPAVTTAHGMEWFAFPRGYTRAQRLKQEFWMRVSLRRATRIICFAENTRSDIYRFAGKTAGSVRLASEAAAKHFQKIDAPRADPFFLVVGSLEPRKNLARVLDAYCAYTQAERESALPLKIVGKEAWKSKELKAQVARQGLTDRVVFLGFIPDAELVTLYNQCRALVFVSLYEGFGLPILEGMACGAPVITSNVSSMPEVAGSAACLVDPSDADSIAAALSRLTHDKDYVAFLRNSGPARALTYSWERAASEVLAVLDEAVDG